MAKRIEECMLQATTHLNVGECYFDLGFYDTRNDIPGITTWIYVGKNLLAGDGPPDDRWYFQEPESLMKKGIFPKESMAHDEVFAAQEVVVLSMFDFNGLIEALQTLKPKLPRK